ncbi:MAG: T9SS type A sorting domain-containing protein [Ferruginibacter sp.]
MKNCLLVFGFMLLNAQLIVAQNCAVNAGTDQTICVGQPLTLTGVAGSPQSAPPLYQWTKLAGPAVTITSSAALTTTVTGLTPGNYVFQLTNRCADLYLAYDQVNITVLPFPPTALAGPDVSQCINTPGIVLNANAVTAPNVGTWTVSPVGGTFSPNANAPNATYTPPVGSNTYTLTWTISNGYCSTSDQMLINIVAPTLPVTAGAPINLSCGGTCVTLNGSSPGLAPPQGGLWTVISGPNTPVITNSTLRNSTVCGLIAGTYTLKWTVSGACGSGFADVTINVANTFDPPVAQGAQAYSTFCGSPAVTSQVLNGTALTAGETGVWTQTSPATPVATFTPNNTVANPTVGNLTGTFPYVFTYVRTNTAGCTASSTHTISRNPAVLNLTTPPDQELACDVTSTSFTISFDNSTSVTTGLTRTGVRISGPAATGTATYSSGAGTPRVETWNVTGLTTFGTYVFRIEYRNGCGSQFRTIKITTSQTPSLVNAGSDIVLPCNTLSANPIGSGTGTGSFTWTQVSGPNTATLAGVNTASLNMSSLIQGVYKMRLSIAGGKACASKTDDMLVTVTQSVPSVATTGANATICAGRYRLTANTPNTPLETGTWTVTPSAGITFSPNANTPNALVSGMATSTAYTFRWTVLNSCGSIFSQQVLTTNASQAPPLPNAGSDICVASGTSTQALNGSAPGTATILWTALDAGSSVSSSNTQATTATLTTAGTYRFEYALTTAGCTTLRDTVVLTRNQAITANAGADIDICAPTVPASIVLTANVAPVGTTATWTQLSGPATVNIVSPNANSTTVNGLAAGVYEFEYRVSTGGICADVADIVVVRVVQEPSAANAGPDQSICSVTTGTTVTLAAITPAVGTGFWQIVSGPPGSTPTFSNALLANSTITNLMNGVYTLRWTTTNGAGCTDKKDDMILTITATANAGANANLCNAPSVNLTGNANTTGTWSYVSGPAGYTITTNSPNTAIAGGLIPGTYVFQYALPIVGACPATTSNITITNYAQPSQANAGPDVQLCFNTSTVTLTGNIPVSGTGTWVRESGPNNPTAGTGNTTYQDTVLNTIIAGLYVYQYRVNTNAVCVASVDKVQIIKEIVANAGTDIRVCNATTVNLSATAALVNTGTWSYVSGPVGSAFTNVNAPNTAVTGLVPGTYIFRWTLSSPAPLGCTANTDDVQVIIDPAVPAMNAGPDITFCEGTAAPFLIGSAAQPLVSYSWTPALFLDNATIAQPTFSGVSNAGIYTYTVTGTTGTCTAFDQVVIKVNPKPFAGISFSSLGCSSVTFTAANPGNGVNTPVYSWTFPSGTPATATGPGPHAVMFTTGSGNKTIALNITSADGCTSNTSAVIDNRCFALPVSLKSFTGSWKNSFTALRWEIASAVSFNYFVVERSLDGVSFSSLSNINYSAANSSYGYDDNNIPANATRLYYRLKMVDIDGRFAYSSIVLISINNSYAKSMFVTPNPVIAQAAVHLFSDVATAGSIRIVDVLGRLIYQVDTKLVKGENVIYINNLAGTGKGIYLVQAIIDGEKLVQKIVVGN